MTGSPPSSRTVVAVSGDRSLLPPRIAPAWLAYHSWTRSYARSRSAWLMACRSLANCSVSTNNSTYFTCDTLLASTLQPSGRLGLAVQLGHPSGHLLRRHVLDVGGDGPSVPERVHDVPVPVAVELVLGGTLQGRAQLHRSPDDRVDVLDVDEQRGRRAGNPAGRRRLGAPLRDLVLDDHHRVPDLDLGVGEGAVGAREAHALGRPKHLGVELEGYDAALHHQAGRNAAVGVRDRLRLGRRCHLTSLLEMCLIKKTIGRPPHTTTSQGRSGVLLAIAARAFSMRTRVNR